MLCHSWSLIFFVHIFPVFLTEEIPSKTIRCDNLLIGQYKCDDPIIDDQTQEPLACERFYIMSDGEETFVDTAPINCVAAPRIKCLGGTFNETLNAYVFRGRISCRWTNGKNYRTALFLSLFLGKLSL